MISWKGLTVAAAAAALGTAPVAAARTAPAPAPAAEQVYGTTPLAPGNTATLVNIGILAALIAIVLVFVADGDDDADSPTSP